MAVSSPSAVRDRDEIDVPGDERPSDAASGRTRQLALDRAVMPADVAERHSSVEGSVRAGSSSRDMRRRHLPPLDDARNSVRGQHVANYLSSRLGVDLFASQPLR